MSDLKKIMGKTLAQWFGLIKASGKKENQDIREAPGKRHDLDAGPATTTSKGHVEDIGSNEPSVWFRSMGPSGTVGYNGPEGSFSMDYEFGGGDTLAIIYIPSPQHWQARTGIVPEKREAVLHTVGRLVVEHQTRGRGSYEIQDSFLLIKE